MCILIWTKEHKNDSYFCKFRKTNHHYIYSEVHDRHLPETGVMLMCYVNVLC
jgi:hypothetical protein